MSRKRSHISLKTKLAAAISKLFFTHEEAKELSEDQILSLVQWDHYPIPHAAPYNGPDAHWNLEPSLIPSHREKTAKTDVPRIAKGRRVSEAEQAFRNRMLAKTQPEAAQVVPSRPKRTIPSRKFQSRKKG